MCKKAGMDFVVSHTTREQYEPVSLAKTACTCNETSCLGSVFV